MEDYLRFAIDQTIRALEQGKVRNYGLKDELEGDITCIEYLRNCQSVLYGSEVLKKGLEECNTYDKDTEKQKHDVIDFVHVSYISKFYRLCEWKCEPCQYKGACCLASNAYEVEL